MAALACEVLELLQQIEVRLGERTSSDPFHQRHPGALRQLRAAAVLAGQKAARQRKKRQDTDAKVAAGGKQFAVDLALQQAVLILRRNVGRKTAGARDSQSLGQLPGGEVAASEVTDFAGVHQVGERLERLLLRRVGVGRVQLIEVDVIRVQAPETVLGGGHHIAPRRAMQVGPLAHRHPELARHDDLAPSFAQRLAQQFFGAAAVAIDVGGVEERDAFVERAIHDRLGLFGVALDREIVAAEAHGRNLEPRLSHVAVFHSASLSCASHAGSQTRDPKSLEGPAAPMHCDPPHG